MACTGTSPFISFWNIFSLQFPLKYGRHKYFKFLKYTNQRERSLKKIYVYKSQNFFALSQTWTRQQERHLTSARNVSLRLLKTV
jgi:hypothetical protein